jgi:hypothetical protein
MSQNRVVNEPFRVVRLVLQPEIVTFVVLRWLVAAGGRSWRVLLSAPG